MSLCTSELTAILGTDCIGDSRSVINSNFALLSADICTAGTTLESLSTTIINLSSVITGLSAKDSSTIDIEFITTNNSSTLSANIVDSSIGTTKLGVDIPTTTKAFLTATKISGIDDVLITNISNNQILAWDASSSRWYNRDEIGTTSQVADGTYQDITVTGTGSTWIINNNAVTTTKLANNAVATSKIENEAVTTSKLASAAGFEAVATDTIQTNAVTTSKINNGAITTDKLATDAVTNSKIVDGTITNAKLISAIPLSVKGNSNNYEDAPSDIVAAAPNGVLRRFNDTIGFGNIDNSATTATSANTIESIVTRNIDGDFACRTVIAEGTIGLQGTALSAILASDAVKLQTSRNIQLTGQVVGSATFDGTGDITITTTGSAESNTGENIGNGIPIYKEKTNNILNFKTLSAGPDIIITSDDNHVIITNSITATPLQAQARAWVYFNAQTGTINSSYNITSIQRLGEGVWYINLPAELFDNANYCVLCNTMQGNTTDPQYTFGGVTGNNSGLYADTACARPDTSSRILYETFKSYDIRSDNVYNFIAVFS